MLDVCWFATLEDPRAVRERLERLRRFYAPLGLTESGLEERGGAVVGWLAPRPLDAVAFGGGLPRGPAAVVEDGPRLRAGTAYCTTLYGCGGHTWSTHAVAAAVVGTGRASVRPEALAELCGLEHLAGEGTLLEGVTAVEPGTLVDLRGGRAVERPGGAPWERLAEDEARDEAGRRLVAALREWVPAARVGAAPVTLGLSAGLDSRVVGAALREAGVPFGAITWGRDEAAGAAEVARVLGVEHEVVEREAGGPDPLLAARWSDGAAPLLATSVAGTPARFAGDVHVTGAGGEVGRAFLYALVTRTYRRPPLERVWRPAARLHGAAPEAVRHVDAASAAMLARAAQRSGHDGWRLLDVVYLDERIPRFWRARTPLADGTLVPAFLDRELAVALVAMPLADRVGGGFHRAFLARHAPELVPPPSGGQRRGVPAPLRRVAHARRRRSDPFATTGRARALPADVERFLLDRALDPSTNARILGEPFLARLRSGVRVGGSHAVTLALQLGAAAAVEDALP